MKKTLLLTLLTLGVSTLITGCGQSVPYINQDTEEECVTINKNLLKVNSFIDTVEKTSAFHLEEAAIAMETPKITVSNNKPKMLKDAAKQKASLEAEHQKLGCEDVIN
jgi:hypothetical protein